MSDGKTKGIRLDAVKDMDLYELLEVSLEATEKEIKKAYRKRALVCHPDKNPGDEKAAERFHQLSQALAVLTDEAARKAYDDVLKARQASLIRNRQLDEKRKKLKDDLDAREAAAADREAKTQDKKSEESLKKELERLQEEGRKQLEEEQERVSQMVRQAAPMAAGATASKPAVGPAKLKVKWKGGGASAYTQSQLQSIFHKYGDVANVVVLTEKRVGLVEMSLKSAAVMASKIETGFADSPFKVKLLDPAESDQPRKVPSQQSEKQFDSQSFSDYETMVMRQMRQAEERKRLEAEILAQDAAE